MNNWTILGAFAQKRPVLLNNKEFMFHQDYDSSHTSIDAPKNFFALMYSSYRTNLVPSDYCPFLSIANDFAGEKFVSREASENRPPKFLVNMDGGFYESVIMKLPCLFELNRIILTILNKTLN